MTSCRASQVELIVSLAQNMLHRLDIHLDTNDEVNKDKIQEFQKFLFSLPDKVRKQVPSA
jgi:hypothetical protein